MVRLFILGCFASLILANQAFAQGPKDDLAAQLAALQAQVSQLETEMSQLDGNLTEVLIDDSVEPRTYAGAELTLLRVFGADRLMAGDDNSVAALETGRVISYRDVHSGIRVILGRENADGLGVRGTWFKMDASADLQTATIPGDGDTVQGFAGETNFQKFNLSMTKKTNFRAWSFLVAGGVSGGKFKTNSVMGLEDSGGPPVDDYLISSQNSFEGWGPSVAIEARSNYESGLNFFTNLEGSLLFGEGNHHFQELGGNDPAHLSNATLTVPVLKAQIGTDWTKPLGCSILTVGVALEAQAWLGVGDGSITEYDPSGNYIGADGTPIPMQDDVGLLGAAFNATLSY
jgi:hypothetical protein